MYRIGAKVSIFWLEYYCQTVSDLLEQVFLDRSYNNVLIKLKSNHNGTTTHTQKKKKRTELDMKEMLSIRTLRCYLCQDF